MKLSRKFVVSLLCRCSAAWKATVGSTVGHQGSVMYACSGRASTTEWGDSSLNALCHLDRLSWNMQHLAASCGCDLSRNFFVPLLIYLATFPLTYRVFQFLGCILEITVTWCDMSEPTWMRSLFQLRPSIGLFLRKDWQSWWNYQGIQGFKRARQGTKWAMPMSFKFPVEEKSGRHPWKSNGSFRPVWGATWAELKWNARTFFFLSSRSKSSWWDPGKVWCQPWSLPPVDRPMKLSSVICKNELTDWQMFWNRFWMV